MKLLWLCNTAPGVVYAHAKGSDKGAVNWVDHVLHDLRKLGMTIRILCPGEVAEGVLDKTCSYRTFREGLPYIYLPELEELFRQELRSFRPDVIHSWGTEYGHTLAMVNAAEKEGCLNRMAASIQGLCSVVARHFYEGVPQNVVRGFTFRDAVRRDNIAQQAKKFARRGELEVAALRKLGHVIGRTDWDRACTSRINPDARYHYCGETLRETFYEGRWQYETCQKHRIFASSVVFPFKGFHYLLEAFAEILKTYPDATLAVPGKSFLDLDLKSRIRRQSYDKYLAKLVKKYHMEEKIEFLGNLTAEGMKEAYLRANVFVLPSTIENSPNSLGEAMLLGVPAVASDVGGVTSLMDHNREGFVYPSTAPYMLTSYVERIFAMEDKAETLGHAAHVRAQANHHPEGNLDRLLDIYEEICS